MAAYLVSPLFEPHCKDLVLSSQHVCLPGVASVHTHHQIVLDNSVGTLLAFIYNITITTLHTLLLYHHTEQGPLQLGLHIKKLISSKDEKKRKV